MPEGRDVLCLKGVTCCGVTADKTDGSARKRAVGSVAEVMLVKRRSYACKESCEGIQRNLRRNQRDVRMHTKRPTNACKEAGG